MHFLEDTYRLINKYNQKTKTAKQYGTEDFLYSAEVHMIEIIGSYETITTTKLAEKLGITKGAVSQITRKLLEKKLIMKIPSNEKVNEVLILLTDKGRMVYSYHRSMHERMLRKIDLIICDLSDEGKMALDKIIQVIDESLDDM
ncbi:MAG: MarR family transcriptional regulator [Lachnospiraceae bacterium]|nr:MarR family transcriptional regulator [Lachnospiraceae bacterium]